MATRSVITIESGDTSQRNTGHTHTKCYNKQDIKKIGPYINTQSNIKQHVTPL